MDASEPRPEEAVPSETKMIEANRVAFEVEILRPAPGEANHKLALCLHGFPEHAHAWRHQLPMLAELGYEVWAPNLRGYGNSSRPPAVADYAIEVLMDDVAGLIDAAGRDEVVLIAHDWGGVIAWYFAMRRLRPLAKLIILAAPHPVPALRALRQWQQLKRSWYVFFFQLPGVPEWFVRRSNAKSMIEATAANPQNFGEEDLAVFREQMRRPGAASAMIHYYRALVRGGGAWRQRRLGYPPIEIPTLLLFGEKDVALSLETVRGTEEVVTNLTLRTLPRVSHWIQQDVPEVTNTMIRAFLEDKTVPTLRWEAILE